MSLLALTLVVHAEDLSSYKSADALWEHLAQVRRKPAKSNAEMPAHWQNVIDVAGSFIQQYPKDPRRWEAALQSAQAAGFLAEANGDKSFEKMKAGMKELAETTEAPTEIRANAAHVRLLMETSAGKYTPELESETRDFENNFPDSKYTQQVIQTHLQMIGTCEPSKAESLMRELVKSPNAKVAAIAKAKLNAMELPKKPLELKFTAVSGEKIDLSKMRGKVVLVDFWATWCGPCMRALPEVLETYKTYHEKGFEVIGISLDEDKAKMLSVAKERGMAWPQYFDGKAFQNEISSSYDIHSIPTVWLVDKKGMVHSPGTNGELGARVEKLLSE